MAKLIVNPTSSNRREISLSRSALLAIGRDPSNDLVLPDAMVSRRHAVIEWRGSQFFVRDCNSSNGSVVNGDRISEKSLRDGDLVAIGTARLLFREELSEPGAKVVQHPSAAKFQCPACSAEYRKGDLYCRECGEKLASPSGPPKVICASCGTAVPLPARFCNACGSPLPHEGERAEAAPPPEAVAAPAPPEAPARASLPPLQSDEPATGPPSPAPVLEPPPDRSAREGQRPGEPEAPGVPRASAAAALPVSALPGSALPAQALPAPVPASVPAPVHVPASAPAQPAAPQVEDGKTVPPLERSTRSGDKLRAVRPGESSGVGSKLRAAGPRPLASFGVRLLAGLVDLVLLGAAEALVLSPVLYYWRSRALPGTPAEVPFAPILASVTLLPVAIVLACAYFVYGWGTRGATFGQHFFGLTVEAEDGRHPIGMGRAWLRLFGTLLSAASLGVGFLMIAFTGSALHDRVAGTRVVQGRRA